MSCFNNKILLFIQISYQNFRLDFITHSKRWGGCSATIVPTEDYVVWGAVWELNECNIYTLDNQEGVADKLYFPLMVDIETLTGKILKCRVYQQCNNPNEHIKLRLLPKHRRPSPLYLYVNLILLNLLEIYYIINYSFTEKQY